MPNWSNELKNEEPSANALRIARSNSIDAVYQELEQLQYELLSIDDPREREYRASVLTGIAHNLTANGPHAPRDHDSRARQFMLFAALKGYTDMLEKEENIDGQENLATST